MEKGLKSLVFLLLSFGYMHSLYSQVKKDITYFKPDISNVYYGWNQSPSGQVFLASRRGLTFFDGKNEHLYPHNGRGKSIENVVFDHEGTLWCNTFKGDVFFLKNDSLIRHPISEKLNSIVHLVSIDTSIFLFHEKNVYLINDHDSFKNLYEEIEHKIRLVLKYKESIYAVVDNRDYSTIVDVFTKKKSSFRYSNEVYGNFLPINFKGELYIYYSVINKMYLFKDLLRGTMKPKFHLPYPSKVTYVAEINNKIAVCGFDGILLYENESTPPKKILSGKQISQAGKDLEGNIIATTVSDGLIIVPDLNSKTINFEKVLNEETIFSTARYSNQYLFAGSNSGLLIRYSVHDHTFDTLRFSYKGEISTIYSDEKRGQIYVYSDSLFVVDAERMRIKNAYRIDAAKLVHEIDGTFYIGTSSLFYSFDGENEPEILFDDYWITGMKKGEKGILVSTNSGMFEYLPTNELKEVSFANLDLTKHLSDFATTSSASTYFVHDFSTLYQLYGSSTAPKDLLTWDKKDIYSIRAIEDQLFLFLDDGLLIYNTKTHSYRVVDDTDGMSEAFCKDIQQIDDKYYIFHKQSATELTSFLNDNDFTPRIVLSPMDQSFSFNSGKWTSDYEQNILSFQLDVVPNIRGKGQGKILYRIPTIDTLWKVWEGKAREFTLERLPIGSYDIEIKAENEDGFYSEVYRIHITVYPPFYLTWWFIVGAVLLLIVIVYVLVKKYIRKIKKKNFARLEKQRLETRALNAELKAIRSQMNPHFIFNVLTAIQAKVITGKSSEAYENIGDFAVLIRNVLDKSGKENITLNEELDLISTYVKLENSRMKRPVNLDLSVDQNIDGDQLLVPTLITQPFIENAFKHAFEHETENKNITLAINAIDNGFEISIKDTGKGFDNSFENKPVRSHQSFALDAIKKRLEKVSKGHKYQAYFKIKSEIGKGTHVRIIFTFK